MSETPVQADALLVRMQGDAGLIKVEGRASFKISASLKEFALAVIDRGAKRLVLHMGDCVSMDSTFMGVLAGLSFRLKEADAEGQITLIELAPRTLGLLATLGLDRAVIAYPAETTPAELRALFALQGPLEELPHGQESRGETAALMLEAHEDLVELTTENLPRFKDVLTFLREDVGKRED